MTRWKGPVTTRRQWLTAVAAVAAAAGTLIPRGAAAQAKYPARPLRVLVPFSAGSPPDVMARLWSEEIQKATGQTVIVENRVGASTIIGTQAAAAAPADGYTVLYTVNNTFSINPHIYARLPYRADDFVPVSRILSVPYVLVVSADSGIRTLQDLVREARARPGGMSYASTGVGGGVHVAMVRLLNAAGISMVHIPYNSSPLADLTSGRLDVYFDASTTAIPLINAGRSRALAVSSAHRIEALPDVPAVNETFPGFVGDSWHGVFVRRGTPEPIVAALAALSQDVINLPSFRQVLRHRGLTPAGGSRAEFQQFLADDSKAWQKVVKDNHIVLE